MQPADQSHVTTSTSRPERVDPRLKLLLTVLAIAGVFATFSWPRLLLLAAPLLFLVIRLDACSLFLRRLYRLRWFFLFIVILHLLLSPGYTLFGVEWLSRDGLFRGLMICAQIVLALAISLALTRSTSTERLAAATVSLLRPLKLLGINVRAFAAQVLLALHFVPILQEESLAAWRELPSTKKRKGFAARIGRLQTLVVPVLLRLVDRADRMAVEVASGSRNKRLEVGTLPSLWPLGIVEWVLIAAGVSVLALYFGLP